MKRPVSSLCAVGAWLLVGDEVGRVGRVGSFWEGVGKELNISPQKLPVYLIKKFTEN